MDEDRELDLVGKMNLLPSERIGFETRQAYLTRLAELSAEGYLTDDEYQSRLEWLEHADTRAKLDLVFRDLPRITVMQRSAYEDYLTRRHQFPRNRKPDFLVAVILLICAGADFTTGGIAGITVGVLMLIFAGVFLTFPRERAQELSLQ